MTYVYQNKQSKTSELNKLDEILDKLSQNPNNTITIKKSDDGILENVFIMTEEQKNGSTGTPKLFILMELLEPMILNTCYLRFKKVKIFKRKKSRYISSRAVKAVKACPKRKEFL